ncbi:hypothetical protein [Hymenobacter bucti]|uniref:Uncharacterized protein n=1 Tax=Hymenobacter bucti TaxID=1844114 RepID=A0ABW4QYN4_9BACT
MQTLPNILDLPTSWGKVTLGQFMRLTELPEQSDVYNFLSVFVDLSPLEVMNLPWLFVNEQVLPVLDFAASTVPDFESFKLPATLTLPGVLHGHELPVLTSLDIISFGQATDLGAVLQDAAMPMMQKRLRTLAIVFYPAYVGGDYDSDAIEDFAEKVCSQATLEEALPITDFFLSSTTSSAVATPPSSSAFPLVEMKKPPASKPSWLNGMRWLWSTRWPLATKPAGPTSSASAGAK